MMKIQTKVVDTEAGLQALENEWNELESSMLQRSVFLTWEWAESWWRVFGYRYQLAVIVVYTYTGNGTKIIVGLAPFVITSNRPSRLMFLGNPDVASDHLDILVRQGYDQLVVEAVCKKIAILSGKWSTAQFDSVGTESALHTVCESIVKGGHPYCREINAPYIKLPSTWDAFTSQRSRNFRYTLSRHRRKLYAAFDEQVKFRQVVKYDDLYPAMNTLFSLHQEVKQSVGLRGAFATQEKRYFHNLLARRLLALDRLLLCELLIADEVVASIYCFRFQNRVSFYQTGYSLRFAQYRPGQQLMAYTVLIAIEKGYEIFDFLRGDEDYKRHWTDENKINQNIRLANGIWGSLQIEADRIARGISHRLPFIKSAIRRLVH